VPEYGVRQNDAIARYFGEEFVAVLPDTDRDDSDAALQARRPQSRRALPPAATSCLIQISATGLAFVQPLTLAEVAL